MEIATKTDLDDNVAASTIAQQLPPQQKAKRKHRRGKPKPKNANKPYKKMNWKFQVPRQNNNNNKDVGRCVGSNKRSRAKLTRSRSLVPYNTNKFLMEEHLAEVNIALLTPSGRTRDSSFSVDSEDNYFFSLPEDEEEFLTKEFANVYEKARVERLENLTKQQLIEECLQIEDRYSSDQGAQRQQQLNVQRTSAELVSKIRILEEKLRELSRENYNLRCQMMRSSVITADVAAASPPSAAAPIGSACGPTPIYMDSSSSQDSESDSSSSNSSYRDDNRCVRRNSCSPHSSISEYNASVEEKYFAQAENDIVEVVNENEEPRPFLKSNIIDDFNDANRIDLNAEAERSLVNDTMETKSSSVIINQVDESHN